MVAARRRGFIILESKRANWLDILNMTRRAKPVASGVGADVGIAQTSGRKRGAVRSVTSKALYHEVAALPKWKVIDENAPAEPKSLPKWKVVDENAPAEPKMEGN